MRKRTAWWHLRSLGLVLLGACGSGGEPVVQSMVSASDAESASGGAPAVADHADPRARGLDTAASAGAGAGSAADGNGAPVPSSASDASGTGNPTSGSDAPAPSGASGASSAAGGSVAPSNAASASGAGGAAAIAGAAGTPVVAGSGSPAAAGADCGKDPLANLQPLGRGFFQEFRGLFGCTKPADLALYREMLPEKFEMPADPQVCFYVVSFAVSGVGPYNEAAILLPIEYAGQAGKYVLTMPLDNFAASSGGRAQGFPKYIAEEVSLSNDGDDWTGVVRNAGEIDLQASYVGACRAGGDFPFPDFINLTPIPSSASQSEAYLAPRTGSALMVTSDLLVDPQFYSLEGSVQIQIGDALPWNGLLDESQAFPAQLVTFKGGIDLGSRALD